MADDLRGLLAERAETHGDFCATALIAQDLKEAMRSQKGACLATKPGVVAEALEAIAMKMARIVAGNERTEDHWRDIQGYAQLVLDWIEREGKR